MRRKMLFGLQFRDFDTGYERRTRRAVALEGNWGITSTSRILSQPEFRAKENGRIQHSITLRANKERDAVAQAVPKEQGRRHLPVWECELKNTTAVVNRIKRFLRTDWRWSAARRFGIAKP